MISLRIKDLVQFKINGGPFITLEEISIIKLDNRLFDCSDKQTSWITPNI
jgi:hypothetical protein